MDSSSNTNWYNAYTFRTLNSSLINPGNQIAQIPTSLFTSEVRPDLRWKTERWSLILRPRIIAKYSQTLLSQIPLGGTTFGTDQQIYETGLVGRWSEAFVGYKVSEGFDIYYGLQNFQWGAAEVASPSNLLFHDTVQNRDALYDVWGQQLFRLNFSQGTNWSHVILLEPGDNGRPEFVAQTPFQKKGLLKSEYNWGGGSDYAGVVLGAFDGGPFWLGQYLNVSALNDAWSFYFDVNEQHGSNAWYPTVDPSSGLILMSQQHLGEDRFFTYAVVGAKYAFENGSEAHVEWIYNQAGYSGTDANNLYQALTNTLPPQVLYRSINSARASGSGLELPGEEYYYISFHIPNLAKFKDLNWILRWLLSAHDGSSFFYTYVDYAIADTGVLFVGITETEGSDGGELKGLWSNATVAGYRHSW